MKMMDIITAVFLPLEMNGMNLTSYLANKGDSGAVDTLLELGGRYEDAAYGYAMANDKHHLNEILEKCPKSKHDACMGRAIRAYARIGSLNDDDHEKYSKDLILGFAQSGCQTKVTSMLDRNIGLFSLVVEGYAGCNQLEVLIKLIKGTNFYPLAIYHAALSGHASLVNELMDACGNKAAPSNWALKGYLEGRHFNDAVRLLKIGADIGQCVSDLKNTNGLPNHELYFAFLAHIKDPQLSDHVLSNMAKRALVINSLEITTADKEKLDRIRTCMNALNLNYLEACDRLADVSSAKTEGEIAFPYLEEVVKRELSIDNLKCFNGISL